MGTEYCNVPCCDLWLSSGPIFSTNPAESFMLGRVRKPPNLPSSINFIDVIDGPAVDWSDIIYIHSICAYIYIWRFPKIEVPPKSSILRGFSIINHPCWDIPIYWNHHIYLPKNNSVEWSCDYDNSGKVWLTIVNVGYVWAPGCFNWRKVQPAIH